VAKQNVRNIQMKFAKGLPKRRLLQQQQSLNELNFLLLICATNKMQLLHVLLGLLISRNLYLNRFSFECKLTPNFKRIFVKIVLMIV